MPIRSPPWPATLPGGTVVGGAKTPSCRLFGDVVLRPVGWAGPEATDDVVDADLSWLLG